MGPTGDPGLEGASGLSRFLSVGEAQGLLDELVATGETDEAVLFDRLLEAASAARSC